MSKIQVSQFRKKTKNVRDSTIMAPSKCPLSSTEDSVLATIRLSREHPEWRAL